jgi:hypothetical protein
MAPMCLLVGFCMVRTKHNTIRVLLRQQRPREHPGSEFLQKRTKLVSSHVGHEAVRQSSAFLTSARISKFAIVAHRSTPRPCVEQIIIFLQGVRLFATTKRKELLCCLLTFCLAHGRPSHILIAKLLDLSA